MTGKRPKPVERAAARLGAVQALYQMDLAGTDVGETLAQFSARASGENFDDGQCGEADYKFLREVVNGAVREQASIDPAVDAILDKAWPMHRLDATVRAILRAVRIHRWHREAVDGIARHVLEVEIQVQIMRAEIIRTHLQDRPVSLALSDLAQGCQHERPRNAAAPVGWQHRHVTDPPSRAGLIHALQRHVADDAAALRLRRQSGGEGNQQLRRHRRQADQSDAGAENGDPGRRSGRRHRFR